MKVRNVIETERLSFRKFLPTDLDKLVEMRSDPSVAKYIGGNDAKSRYWNRIRLDFYISCYESHGFGMHLMIWRETGAAIGWSGLQPLEDTDEIEVSYGLIRDFWRMGIGYEAALGWMKQGFEEFGLDRIVAVAMPENVGSCRILEKLGMTLEKTEEHYDMLCNFYAISRNEFLKE